MIRYDVFKIMGRTAIISMIVICLCAFIGVMAFILTTYTNNLHAKYRHLCESSQTNRECIRQESDSGHAICEYVSGECTYLNNFPRYTTMYVLLTLIGGGGCIAIICLFACKYDEAMNKMRSDTIHHNV